VVTVGVATVRAVTAGLITVDVVISEVVTLQVSHVAQEPGATVPESEETALVNGVRRARQGCRAESRASPMVRRVHWNQTLELGHVISLRAWRAISRKDHGPVVAGREVPLVWRLLAGPLRAGTVER